MVFSGISASADQCTCNKEVIGQRKSIDYKTRPYSQAAAVDTKRGNYFLLQSDSALEAIILNSSGSKILTITISAEPARSSYAFDFSVIYNADHDRYFVVWNAPDPSGGNQFVIYGQFVDASTGKLLRARLNLAKGKFAGVRLIANRVNKQYILAYQTRNQQNNPTFWLRRLAADGGLIGSPVNFGIHAESFSIQQDPATNRFLLAWTDQYTYFLVFTKELERVSSKKRIVAMDPHAVYSARRKSFVLFFIGFGDQNRLQYQEIDAKGEFSGATGKLFRLAKIFGTRTNPDSNGFLVLYPRFTGPNPDLLFARIREDFSVEENTVPFACSTLYRVSAILLSNPVNSEFLAIWYGDEQQFEYNSKTYFQRIRFTQTGTCN